MHPQVEEEKVEIDNRKKYMIERTIQEELKNGVIEKYVRVYKMGKDDALYFVKCEDCYGPMIGHLEKKCPKEYYSYEDVVKFEKYIESMEGFQEAIWEEMKRTRQEEEKVRVKELEEEVRVKRNIKYKRK